MVKSQFNNEQLSDGHSSELSSSPTTANQDDVTAYNADNSPFYKETLLKNESVHQISNENVTYWSGKTRADKTWKVYLGDTRSVLSNMPDNIFNCVITSPPYYWL